MREIDERALRAQRDVRYLDEFIRNTKRSFYIPLIKEPADT
jgi:hypothetical protein